MKITNLLSLISTAFVAISQPAWAGGGTGFHGGGFGGGFRGGGFGAGGFRGSALAAQHAEGGAGSRGGDVGFGGPRVGSFNGGGISAAPTLSGGSARFTGRSVGPSGSPFRYYNGSGDMPATRTYASGGRQNRSITSSAGRPAMIARSQDRSGAIATRNTRTSTAAVQRAIAKHNVFARHDGNWHHDWDRHRAHFDHGHVFVFVGGSWWGLDPWDYYPHYGYGYYPYDYSYDYPYDYSGYPYDGADYSPSQPYSYYNGYAPSGQYSNAVVSAVQSKLASFGYYHGVIDGILGDESQAALARYQQDQDLSVTGTVTAATLRALGLPYSAGS